MICDSQVSHDLRPAAEEEKHILMGETYLHGCIGGGDMMTEELEKRIGPVDLV
jgi:hypothetical protein